VFSLKYELDFEISVLRRVKQWRGFQQTEKHPGVLFITVLTKFRRFAWSRASLVQSESSACFSKIRFSSAMLVSPT
jgi:hypothetical protein